MITRELIKKIRTIEIYTSKLVNDQLAGQYHSVFKGLGMSFEEVRQYQPGDDIRLIDWNVSARLNDVFIKRFTEEREMRVMLLVDMSASGLFGTTEQTKRELAAEVAAVLAFSAIKNNDCVGLIIFTDEVEKFVPPKKGRKHVLRVVSEILTYQPKSRRTNLAAPMRYLGRVAKRRSVAFLLSDFLGPFKPAESGSTEEVSVDLDFLRALRITSRRHDLIPISIRDPYEFTIPANGLLNLVDGESGEEVTFDAAGPEGRAYVRWMAQLDEARDALFRRLDMDAIAIRSDRPYLPLLLNFYRAREKRLRH